MNKSFEFLVENNLLSQEIQRPDFNITMKLCKSTDHLNNLTYRCTVRTCHLRLRFLTS